MGCDVRIWAPFNCLNRPSDLNSQHGMVWQVVSFVRPVAQMVRTVPVRGCGDESVYYNIQCLYTPTLESMGTWVHDRWPLQLSLIVGECKEYKKLEVGKEGI